MNHLTSRIAQMASQTPLKEFLNEIPHDLQGELVTDEHLVELASHMTQWRELSPFLALSQTEEEMVISSGSQADQRMRVLQIWRKKFGAQAT